MVIDVKLINKLLDDEELLNQKKQVFFSTLDKIITQYLVHIKVFNDDPLTLVKMLDFTRQQFNKCCADFMNHFDDFLMKGGKDGWK